MNDPYQTLGLNQTADEAAIRARYLELVRQFPPDRDPEKFAEIRAAYDQLRDPVETLKKRLFDLESPETFETIIADSRVDVRSKRLATSQLLDLAKP